MFFPSQEAELPLLVASAFALVPVQRCRMRPHSNKAYHDAKSNGRLFQTPLSGTGQPNPLIEVLLGCRTFGVVPLFLPPFSRLIYYQANCALGNCKSMIVCRSALLCRAYLAKFALIIAFSSCANGFQQVSLRTFIPSLRASRIATLGLREQSKFGKSLLGLRAAATSPDTFSLEKAYSDPSVQHCRERMYDLAQASSCSC